MFPIAGNAVNNSRNVAMIVRAVGITVEEVLPRGAMACPVRGTAGEWLVVTSDSRLRAELVAAIGRRGGIVENSSAIDEWCRLTSAGRRYAFVDLVAADDGTAAGFLVQLARPRVSPRPKVIVRGVDGDAAGELLARRAEAIVYLTGEVHADFLDSVIAEISLRER